MSRMMFLIVAPLLFNPDPSTRQGWSAKLVDFGTYEVRRGNSLTADTVAGGFVEVTDEKLIERTDQVVATLGVNFGFRYTISGPADSANVTIKILHPRPLRDATGKEFATSEWTQWLPVNQVIWNGWLFENDWEIEPGTWVIQIWVDGQLQLERAFAITDGRRTQD